jgi:hypothetical protein
MFAIVVGVAGLLWVVGRHAAGRTPAK